MATHYLGVAKYIMRGENTFVFPGEAWFEIVDAGGARLCRVPMTSEQAKMCAAENRLETLSPAAYLRLLTEKA